MMRCDLLLLVLLALFAGFPVCAGAADETGSADRGKNYAVAPIVVSNPSIGTGAGATGMFFYDVGSDGEGQPRSSVQLVGAYTHTDSYFAGLMNSLHMLQDRVRGPSSVWGISI